MARGVWYTLGLGVNLMARGVWYTLGLRVRGKPHG